VDNKYPRAFQGLRTDWISFFTFPFVVLSQKQRIKRYNLQFSGKEKHRTSLQSLKTFFSQKAERQIWWLALKCSKQEFYYSTHPPLHWELRLIQYVRYSKPPTMALHKFVGGLKPSLVATCLSLQAQYTPEAWGRWQSLEPTRRGTTLSTNNVLCWQAPAHQKCPLQGSLSVRSSPSLACTLQRQGIMSTQPLQNRSADTQEKRCTLTLDYNRNLEHGLVFPSWFP